MASVAGETGDQFFLPDSRQFYYRQLPDETHLRYVPNAGHGLDGTDAFETLAGLLWRDIRILKLE